jgi:hypothetical protein
MRGERREQESQEDPGTLRGAENEASEVKTPHSKLSLRGPRAFCLHTLALDLRTSPQTTFFTSNNNSKSDRGRRIKRRKKKKKRKKQQRQQKRQAPDKDSCYWGLHHLLYHHHKQYRRYCDQSSLLLLFCFISYLYLLSSHHFSPYHSLT